MRVGPILIYAAGVALFCVMDALMKHLVASYPVAMATFWRYLFALPFILLFWWHEGRPPVTREMLPVHALRGLFIAASAFLFFWSLKVLPLAEAVTIAFAAPLMIPWLAALFLRERLAARSVVAGLIGFGGVLVAAGGGGLADGTPSVERWWGIGAALAAAFTYALHIVLMRLRAARDGPGLISLLGAVMPALYVLPVVGLSGGPWTPDLADLGWFAAAGLAGALALQLIARAYAQVEAQRLAPFEYTALLWAALIGWFAFGEPVRAATWAGAAIIAAACLWDARRRAAPGAASPAAPA